MNTRAAAKSPRSRTGNTVNTVERTKERVLNAAIEEFGGHGLAGARVEKIAKRAKVNKQALYYHYGDKDSLFQAALLFGYASSFRLADIDWRNDKRTPTELMSIIVGDFFDLVANNKKHISLIADENRSKGRHLTKKALEQIRHSTQNTITAIESVLRRGQEAGEFSKDIDPIELYLFIVGQPIFYFNHRYTLSGILGRKTDAEEWAARHRASFSAFVLAGLRG